MYYLIIINSDFDHYSFRIPKKFFAKKNNNWKSVSSLFSCVFHCFTIKRNSEKKREAVEREFRVPSHTACSFPFFLFRLAPRRATFAIKL